MTEINDNSEKPEQLPPAFGDAIVLAPILCSVPFIVILFVGSAIERHLEVTIPIPEIVLTALITLAMAPLMGLPSYLTIGFFLFRFALLRGYLAPWHLVLAGLTAHTISSALISLITLSNPLDPQPEISFYFWAGAAVATLWSAIFAVLYRRLS